ncbi:MAG: transporter [Lachnospiraceae bacterium]|nr:transporter [Lachnospiraceae bacterium]
MIKKLLYFFVIILLILFLLVDPTHAVAASTAGLMLWFQSLVPTLLPFLILSNLLIAIDGISYVTRFLYPVFHRIFGCSRDGCFCLAAGFLCGYPVGAKVAADLTREHLISVEEGNYLLSFCNNVSPAFLISYCLTDCLKRPDLLGFTLLCIYGVPVLLAIVWRRGRNFQSITAEKKTSRSQISFKIVDVCMMNGLESILKLGCYIILFSMLARLLMRIPCPFSFVSYGSVGLLEITNGISLIASDPSVPTMLKYTFVMGFVAFGGLSGAAQTESMILDSGLSFLSYLKAKLLTAALVIFLALIFILLNP